MDNIKSSERLKELREEKGLSHKRLSEELDKLGVSVSDKMLMNYEAAARQAESGIEHSKADTINGMKIETAVGMAEYFNVTVDYLVGNTDKKTPSTDITAICEYTGLSPEAVENLHNNTIDYEPTREKISSCCILLNFLLSNENIKNFIYANTYFYSMECDGDFAISLLERPHAFDNEKLNSDYDNYFCPTAQYVKNALNKCFEDEGQIDLAYFYLVKLFEQMIDKKVEPIKNKISTLKSEWNSVLSELDEIAAMNGYSDYFEQMTWIKDGEPNGEY